jgi:hypothetical protein
MERDYTLGLCLLNCVPNLAFLAAGIFLVCLSLLTKRRQIVLPMVVGTCLIFLGGLTQATWKFVYMLGLGDPRFLSDLQFVLLAPGFLLMLTSVLFLLRVINGQTQIALPAIAACKIPLLGIMTLGSL